MKTIHRVTEGMAEAYARLELRFEALLRVSSTVVSLEPPRWCCCVFHHLFSADHLALQSCFHLFGLKRLLFTGWHHARFGVHGKGKKKTMVMLPLYVGGSRVKCVFPSSKNRTRMFCNTPGSLPRRPQAQFITLPLPLP